MCEVPNASRADVTSQEARPPQVFPGHICTPPHSALRTEALAHVRPPCPHCQPRLSLESLSKAMWSWRTHGRGLSPSAHPPTFFLEAPPLHPATPRPPPQSIRGAQLRLCPPPALTEPVQEDQASAGQPGLPGTVFCIPGVVPLYTNYKLQWAFARSRRMVETPIPQ